MAIDAALPDQRHLFDIPDDVCWLNAAYFGPLLREAHRRMVEGAGRKLHPWTWTPPDFFHDAEAIRAGAAAALGGTADDWAIVPSASYGIETAMRGLSARLGPGRQALVLAETFPSIRMPVERACAERGAALAVVPRPEDGDWTAAVLSRLTPGVALLALPQVHWTDGAALDLQAIGAAAREMGAALVLDTTQSLGAMPLDLARVQPDLMVAGGYKWLLFPYGVSLLYVRPDRQDGPPLEEGWQGRLGAENFGALLGYEPRYQPGARRFDVGEKGASQSLPGAVAALEQLGAWRVDRVAARLSAINHAILSELSDLPLAAAPEALRSPHLMGLEMLVPPPESLVQRLGAQGVHISQRGRALRIAPHMHVTENDIARFADAMRAMFRTG